jgi:hypothetical protein
MFFTVWHLDIAGQAGLKVVTRMLGRTIKLNWLGKVSIVLSLPALANISLAATGESPANNPYAMISSRNVFGLLPPPPLDSPAPVTASTPAPAQIALKGITSLFGPPEVLFVASEPPSPEHAASAKSYILSQGDQADGIEVKAVNEQTGAATFVNHGIIQEIRLGVTQNDSPERNPTVILHHPF